MDQMVINAKTRKETGKKAAKQLRAAGHIPAIMYNAKGVSTMLDIDEAEFNKVWRSITPTTLITLNVDGKNGDAFIKDTEYNIRDDRVLHADFFEPAADELITVKMKVRFSGTPAGVLKGGFMVTHTPEVLIKAAPKKLPVRLLVDVSKVNIGEVFCVKDLELDKAISVLTSADTPLMSISPAR